MPRIVKQLSDTEIKKVKPKEKDFKISDGKGLYLVVKKNGTKFFRFDFSFGGKRKSMSFGIYPNITLKEARERRTEAKKLLEININPINQKKVKKEEEKLTLEFITMKWLESLNKKLAEDTRKNYKDTLVKNVLSSMGKVEVKNIKRIDIVNIINSIENGTASKKRIFNFLSRIFSFSAVAYNLDSNPVDFKITDILPKTKIKNHKAIINSEDIKILMKKINEFNVKDEEYLHYSGVYCIKILPYIFVRISSLIKSEWKHIDLKANTWLFPAENTKTKKDYLYPIPRQVRELLIQLKEITMINSKYVFHSAQNRPSLHLSRATASSYLTKELGYKGKMTLHGFRSTFSTTAYENDEEHGYSSFVIEACLSHEDNNKVRRAYNRESLTKYFNQKKEIIQWYANWLDSL